MSVDLGAIRARLASLVGFTPGPLMAYKWSLNSAEHVASEVAQAARNGGGSDLHAVIKQNGDAGWIYTAFTGNGPTSGPNASIAAAAPDLHRDLSEAADEIERLRAQVAAAREAERADVLAFIASQIRKTEDMAEKTPNKALRAAYQQRADDWDTMHGLIQEGAHVGAAGVSDG